MRATSKAVKKNKFRCKGGPMDGEFILLATEGTVTFTSKGMKGRYRTATTEKRETGEQDAVGNFKNVDADVVCSPIRATFALWVAET